MILISSVGADSNSKYFYTRMKGKLEDDFKEIGFETYHIIRSSLILGDRNEFRPGENLLKLIMGSLAFMIPWKYKPIEPLDVAEFIKYLITTEIKGTNIWEGKHIFQK